MKIYTRTGDKGTTGLIGGKRVSKSSPRIAAYGEVDELNAVIGLVCAETSHDALKKPLFEIQNALFVVGAHLAAPDSDPKVERINSKHIETLERQIDVMDQTLKPLKQFILPGGTKTASLLHLSRTVCRRAERSVVSLVEIHGESVDPWVVTYLNRLSDYLFTLARLSNHLEKVEDVPWVTGR